MKRRKPIKYFLLGRMFEDIDLYQNPFWVFLYKSIQGIGMTTAKHISKLLGISCEVSLKSMSISIKRMKQYVKFTDMYIKQYNLILGRSLIRTEQMNMVFEIKRGSYRGFRYLQQLPVRHQRTHTNANSVKRLLISKSKYLKVSTRKTR